MKKQFLLIIAAICTQQVTGQVRAIQEADDLFNGREYYSAARYFEEIASQNKHKNADWTLKLAECYRNLKDYPRAAEHYATLVDHKGMPVDMYLHYGHTLRYLGREQEAKAMYEKYKTLGGKNANIETYIQGCNYALQTNLPKQDFTIKPANLTTEGLYLGGAWFDNGLIYSVPHTTTDEKTRITYPKYSLVYSAYADGKFNTYTNYPTPVSTNFYLGSPVVSADGNTLYYTGNDSEIKFSGKKKFAKNNLSHYGTNTLNIYACKKSGNGWSAPAALSFNSADYSTTTPSLSPDGSRMVFASNKPGGKGGYDLYIAENHGDSWSSPQSLGDAVNSPDDELFPCLANDSTLYFSSNGWIGFGGADLYVSHLRHGHWSAPENMGKGFNSVKDDFGIFFTGARSGFFASNRNTDPGKDELFMFEKTVHYRGGEGEVTDKLYLNRLEGVEVDLYEGNQLLTTLYTDRKGDYEYTKFDEEKKYSLHVKKKGYKEQEMDIDPLTTDLKHLDFKLEPIIEKNTVLTFNDILFEYGKAEVLGDSRTILARVTDLLLSNPGAKIELSAHTDSRGSDKANMILSQKRAQACVDILIASGVDPNNLIAKGYGESKLKNNCGNKSTCTEEEHAINRRVEIKVLEVK